LVVLFFSLVAGRPEVFGQNTAFTYQGRLLSGGVPASGFYNFTFGLYPTNAGGIPAGSILTNSSVLVSNGLFTTILDFGPVFDGTTYWLEIEVQPVGGTNSFSILSPRQSLNSTPYAAYAANAGTVAGVLATTNLPPSVAMLNSSANFSGTVTAPGFAGDGSGLTNLNASQLAGGTLPDAQLSTNVSLLNGNNNWTGTNNFANGLSTGSNFVSTFNGSNAGWQLMQRAVINILPVPSFRPTGADEGLALDGMPNGNPGDGGDGVSWLDWCLEDCFGSNPIIHSIHLATHPTIMEISSICYNGGTALPFGLGYGDGSLVGDSFPIIISPNGQVTITNPVIRYNYKPAFYTNYTAGTNDQILFCNGTNQLITLPAGAWATEMFTIISTSTHGWVLVTNASGSITINGGLSQRLGASGSGTNRLTVIYDGANWQ
jgi:hypothetical protein